MKTRSFEKSANDWTDPAIQMRNIPGAIDTMNLDEILKNLRGTDDPILSRILNLLNDEIAIESLGYVRESDYKKLDQELDQLEERDGNIGILEYEIKCLEDQLSKAETNRDDAYNVIDQRIEEIKDLENQIKERNNNIKILEDKIERLENQQPREKFNRDDYYNVIDQRIKEFEDLENEVKQLKDSIQTSLNQISK